LRSAQNSRNKTAQRICDRIAAITQVPRADNDMVILSDKRFFYLFSRLTKAKPVLNTIYRVGELSMRKPRRLEALAWYWIVTAINRHEPIFLERAAVDLFNRVLREAGERFAIEVRHLVIHADRMSFYIKPADGLQLPEMLHKFFFSIRFSNTVILAPLKNGVNNYRQICRYSASTQKTSIQNR
jgi:hypothetical protein